MTAVLIVEDEKHLARGAPLQPRSRGLRLSLFQVMARPRSRLLLSSERHFDAVLLDVMLPGKSGFDVAAELRGAGQFVPVLMLTARDQPQDVLRGFESGADDYLAKPFELAILLARLGSLLRRYRWLRRE